MGSVVTQIDTSPADLTTTAAIEAAEAEAWADLYAAAPSNFAGDAGIGFREVAGALVISWAATGRRYFSRTIGLGVAQPVTPAALEDVLDGYQRAGITMFLLQSLPQCRPAAYESWLRERGLKPFDQQDRIVRGGAPLTVAQHRRAAQSGYAAGAEREIAVERVDASMGDEWADYIQRVYRLDTGSWLQNLIGRSGWHQYVAREGGEIVAARGMFVCANRIAWLGMDGPVPGVMTDDYEPDAALCEAIVADGLVRGVRMFIADIEAPSPAMDTPAYDYFGWLGFTRPYARTHWRTGE